VTGVQTCALPISDQRAQREKEREKQERERERAAWWKERGDYAFRSYFDYLLCGSFVWGDGVSGGSWDVLGIHWSFLPFTSIGVQGEVSFLEAGGIDKDVYQYHIAGVIFNAGLVYPLTTNWSGMNVSLYGDGLLEINMADLVWEGLLADRITPGFDAGISFMWGRINGDRSGIDIKYRGLWYKDRYLNAIGIAYTLGWWRIVE
jgi:hypothetical protein